VSTYYARPQHYAAMQRRAMQQRFSWDESARQYEQAYLQAIQNKRARG